MGIFNMRNAIGAGIVAAVLGGGQQGYQRLGAPAYEAWQNSDMPTNVAKGTFTLFDREYTYVVDEGVNGRVPRPCIGDEPFNTCISLEEFSARAVNDVYEATRALEAKVNE